MSEDAKGMKKTILKILKIKGATLSDLKKSGFMKVVVDSKKGKYGGIMDLSVDYLGKEGGLDKYAIAHNYIQNGDLMTDPDMEFYDFGDRFYAGSFEQSNLSTYQRSIGLDKQGKLSKNPQLQKQHQTFSNQWSRNLEEQGFTKVKKEDIHLEHFRTPKKSVKKTTKKK